MDKNFPAKNRSASKYTFTSTSAFDTGKYKGSPLVKRQKGILPYLCNQKINEYLKAIGKLCSINKWLRFHLARHTFATTVTLANGIPMETVSKMLGHTKLSTTQIYVHVLKRKISDDMKLLRNKFREQTK